MATSVSESFILTDQLRMSWNIAQISPTMSEWTWRNRIGQTVVVVHVRPTLTCYAGNLSDAICDVSMETYGGDGSVVAADISNGSS
jgi:hypothetical protein